MALPAPQISAAAAVRSVRWPAMNPNTIAATTETPIATSNATTALIRPRALNISLESGMRRLSVQVKSGVRSQHFTFHSLNARTHSWSCLQEPQPSGVRFAQFAWHAVASAKAGRSRSPSARALKIIPNHDDFVEECLERNFFRLKRSVRRLHNQRPTVKP